MSSLGFTASLMEPLASPGSLNIYAGFLTSTFHPFVGQLFH